MQFDAGMLNRRIVILRNTGASRNSIGEAVENWTTLATVWARYTPASDAEKMNVSENFATLEGRFVIRWSGVAATINAKDELQFDGRLWNVLGAKEIERHRWIEITAGTRGER